jgi:hypothetical protein
MALIELNPELSKLTRAVERVAEALELILLHQYKVRVEATSRAIPDPNPAEKQTVSYASDDDQVRQRLEELGGMFRREQQEEEEVV